MTAAEAAGVLLLGLAGGVHCLGMCSAFVLCLGGEGARRRRQASYQAGRLLSYALLGAVMGSLGLAARRTWEAHGGQAALAVAGLAMVAMGLGLAGGLPRLEPRSDLLLGPLRRLLSAPSPRSAFGLGWLTGFLPCGLLYAGLARAAAAGSPAEGALVMALFWAGTAPALALAGLLHPLLRGRRTAWWPRLAGSAAVLLGLATLHHALLGPSPCCH